MQLAPMMSVLNINEEIAVPKIIAANINFGSKKNFRYYGSLTTPPCSENVIWTVEERVRTISREQINLLKGSHQPLTQFI
ncbi:hypothetical protein M8C21_026001 [Ambrosia artemisiifolia]|uniref:Alpha-carbonic anhydrase domain-containing protein n=1 Tax=Ambrosia artemisiifolia TaxID=4212 RepID=A0AAD5D6B2_AMBAR|nr:hypothetical protein M8C21_026001 [Ambrosia artemisiifolia]